MINHQPNSMGNDQDMLDGNEDNSGEMGEDILDEEDEQLAELSDQEKSPQEIIAESQQPYKI